MSVRLLLLLCSILSPAALIQAQPLARPPEQAERFAPGVISKDHWSFTPTFTSGLDTLYYVRWERPDLPGTLQKLYRSHWQDGQWTEPVTVAATQGYRVDWPHVSPGGRRLYLSFTKPHRGEGRYDPRRDDFDLWAAPLAGGAFDAEALRPLEGPDLNRAKTESVQTIGYVHNETGPRLNRQGNLYFWTERLDDGGGRRDLYFARNTASPEAPAWARPELLPALINTAVRETGLAVDPDGRWIIFASERTGGYGGSDLYYSVRLEEGWSEPVNLGARVNTAADEVVPELTPDGRALFFTSDRAIPGLVLRPDVDGEPSGIRNIYWVGVDALGLPASTASGTP